MAHLKEIVDRISLIDFTKKITKSMKMVSSSKLSNIQQILTSLKFYTIEYKKLLHTILQDIDKIKITHPLIQKKIGKKRLLAIVVTSNKGLCGAFNKNVLKKAYEYIKTYQQKECTTIEVLAIGKKAHQFFKKYNLFIIENYINILENSNDHNINELTSYCIESFNKNYYTEIILIYTSFKNSAKQKVKIVSFLPFSIDLELDCISNSNRSIYYIYEPSQVLLIEKLIPEIVKHKIMHMLVESSASEHASRMATMSQATDNANKLLKVLRISYNKTRQAFITRSLAEITSGAEVLVEA